MRVSLPRLGVLGLALCCAEESSSRPAPEGEPLAAVSSRPARTPALKWHAPPSDADRAPPMQLTASDGTGLALRSLEVSSVVTDPLAYTELHLVFDNPEDRVLEGRFEITLPPNAAISRFAMRIDERWQEGEVVELQAARRAYEDFLHRRQDPALLEKDAGNKFRARVFPIPARGRKHLILAYSHELGGADEPLELALRGLPELERFEAKILVDRFDGAPQLLEVSERAFAPDRDLRVVFEDAPPASGLRHGELAVVRVHPELDLPEQRIRELSVLFDTSASRALGFGDAVARLDATLDALAADQGNFDVRVLCFDQAVVPCFEGKAKAFGPDDRAAIEQRGALGASDLEGALAHVAQSRPHERLLLVTDGVATAGATDSADLRAAAKALEAAGVVRIDALVDGGLRDEALLAELVTAGLPHDGVVAPATGPEAIVSRLTGATRSGVEVHIPGAQWVWPDTLHGLQSGDPVLIYAHLPPDAPLEIQLDGAVLPGPLQVADTDGLLLTRAAAQANIARMEHLLARGGSEARKTELRESIVRLSTRNRVLSDYTALLVLETAEDYERYGIAQTDLADILVVGPEGLTRRARTDLVVAPAPPEAKKPKADAKKKSRNGDHADNGAPEGNGDSFGPPADFNGDADPGADPPPPAPPPPPPQAVASGLDISAAREEAEMDERPVASPRSRPRSRPRPSRAPSAEEPPEVLAEEEPAPDGPAETQDAWSGRFEVVMEHLKAGRAGSALEEAKLWRAEAPGDVLALVALGEVAEARGDLAQAARAYGSIIDLFPSRADLRRMAGERLERLGDVGLALAADTYRQAVAQRPDHPSSHRLYAYALVKQERYEEALDAILEGHGRTYPDGRFRGVPRILKEDAGLIGAAWARSDPGQREAIAARVREATGSGLAAGAPEIRFVLYWETDANDVDFHIYDGEGGHAYYSSKVLPSGGELYADVTTGYGPECFTISKPSAHPYTLQAHYYSRGPMGYGMGTLEIMRHDGEGGLSFEAHPYVIMEDGATIGLGVIED